MDKNNVIGLTLIFILFFVWAKINAPTEAELKEMKRLQDSTAMAEAATQPIDNLAPVPTNPNAITPANDSLARAQAAAQYGSFGSATSGTEEEIVLENELVKITFTNKGGRVKKAELKNYYKHVLDSAKNEIKTPLLLLEDDKNKFDFILPVNSVAGGKMNTGNLFFQPTKNGNTISFKLPADNGGYFEQKYTLKPGSYRLDYDVALNGMAGQLTGNEIQLDWTNYLDKIELNHTFERTYSSIYYKEADESPSYCSCTGDDKEEFGETNLKWIAHSNQFFQTSLTAKEYFKKGVLETVMMDSKDADLKKLRSNISIPISNTGNSSIAMDMFIGPKEYDLLKEYDNGMEYSIAFGPSIFGTINRYMIRPLFNFLSQFIGSKGIVILALTLLVKMLLYPFMYKMIYSQSKMAALKPQIAAMGDKFKDDPQAKQMETMKLYREFGVNPMGGCLPVILQMPIWFALYRFFPSSIEFRQQPFLWATDLSSFDVFTWLPWEIPFYGQHLSLFTLLWAISTVAYTFYNSRHMDMSANPMMKYMQYMMPLMFLFFFNNYASGLTCYLLFSNIFNVAQMIVTKNYLIDKKKIEAELQNYKNKPKKKKTGFSAKLEEAMKEQKKRLADQEKAAGKAKTSSGKKKGKNKK